MYKWEHLAVALKNAIDMFLNRDMILLDLDVNERTLSTKLASYISQLFPNYDVDCEYNRHGDDIKRLPAPEPNTTDDATGKTIFPDIVVHSRGNDLNNLCVIEIKKVNNPDTARDFQKLERLTHENLGFHYTYGFHLIFGNNSISGASVYQGGVKNEALTTEFENLLDI